MNVTPIEHEPGRFFVQSQSRPIEHTVDLRYKEEPRSKPKPACGCESNFIHGRLCPHILAVVNYEKARLGL